MISRVVLAVLLFTGALGAAAAPPEQRVAVLRRGVNITNWFRYPPSRDPAALRHYLSDRAISQLQAVGFSFVRLPVQPDLLAMPATLTILTGAIRRLERAGLAVVVELHPLDWHLETSTADRDRLLAGWHVLAPALRPLDPDKTFPELLNEPVFAGDPSGWQALQHRTLAAVRAVLPLSTIVLTGANWGSIGGLLALNAEADGNVIYSFHLYDPAELTALAAYRPGLDTGALARLPFPADDAAACQAAAPTVDMATADLIQFYCAMGWNPARLQAQIGAAAEWGRANHAALLAGEFGASRRLNSAARLTWLMAARQGFEQLGIGWALWGYDDTMGFGIRPTPQATSLDNAMFPALGLTGQVSAK
jgi:hypothetical protein